MITLKKLLLLTTLFLFTFPCISENIQLTDHAKISIITYGPGEVLYEKFGHTAIRVKDPVLQLDMVYNYGFFDFNQANFYLNFIRGFMKYKLVRYSFPPSLKAYQNYQRWAKEQVLQLTLTEKNAFFNFLEENAIPENASYFYDPFFNNCSSKPVNIIKKILGDKVVFDPNYSLKNKTLRQLMNYENDTNTWGSLGINIALGSRLDAIATPEEYLFLPDYVFLALENASLNSNTENKLKLVEKTITLLDYPEIKPKNDIINPTLVFYIVALFGFYITYKDYQKKSRTKWLDICLFSFTGLIGLLIVFLWFFTNHSTAPNNFNFLWAFAPNLIICFLLIKKNPPKWVSYYIILNILLLTALPVIWIAKIQLFPISLISFFILLLIRYVFIYNAIKNFE